MIRSPRVALAGLFHETHVFLDGTTALGAFDRRDGDAMLTARGDGSPLDGVLEVAERHGWDLIPTVDLRATPGATAEDAVVEAFWDALTSGLEGARQDGGIDALFLVLHGAMASVSHPDVEQEILTRLAEHLGPERPPVFGVVDLHANLGPLSVRNIDALLAYRRNPHDDARDAAVRAAELAARCLANDERPRTYARSAGVIWAPTGTGSHDAPMRDLLDAARLLEDRHADALYAVEVLAGFAYGDAPEMGAAVLAVARPGPKGVAAARDAADELCDLAWASRRAGVIREEDPDVLLPRLLPIRSGTVVLSEPSDNIGGGAPGDGTGALRALLKHDVLDAFVSIADPAAVEATHDVPIGGTVRLRVGGRGSRFDRGPLPMEATLLHRSDGAFELEDRRSHLASMVGAKVRMGPCAVVRHLGVTILLTSRRTPPFDLGQLRSQGLEPTDFRVIVAKAAVAHRRAYDRIATEQYALATPGPCPADLTALPYRRRPRPAFPFEDGAIEARSASRTA